MRTTTVYLLCFDEPIGTSGRGMAQHYIGSSASLEAELARHRNGSHAAIMREVNRRGIGWELVRTWPGGRREERRLKDQGGHGRQCPRHAVIWNWMIGDVMIGGYSAIAAELNKRFPGGPVITRQRVANWDNRRTRNKAGNTPPRVHEIRDWAPRTQPRRVFEVELWVAWYRAGTPGWYVPAEAPAGEL
jgi:hypothetical protein